MIKLLTLNLNYYGDKHGTWDERLKRASKVVKQATPDIIALQAVRSDPARFGGFDQAVQLSRELGGYSEVVFQPAESDAQRVSSGNALLSRLPIAKVDQIKLSQMKGVEDQAARLVQVAQFDLPGGPLHLFNAHFSWVKEQFDNNLAETLPYLREIQHPALMVGDFNAPAGQGWLYLMDEIGWVDVWESLHPGEPGFTFEAGNPTLRIDYAWANSYLAPRLVDVKTIEGEGGDLSDHLGLAVTLDL